MPVSYSKVRRACTRHLKRRASVEIKPAGGGADPKVFADDLLGQGPSSGGNALGFNAANISNLMNGVVFDLRQGPELISTPDGTDYRNLATAPLGAAASYLDKKLRQLALDICNTTLEAVKLAGGIVEP
jgi:hypothetical protein